MSPHKYAITFACYNQVEYTKKCIESMIKHGVDLSRLVVVDNASIDSTQSYLETLPLGELILNQGNLGCGVAWNQGALALQAEWTIIMNNDVIVSEHWIENLIETAEKNNLKVISPSLIEGELDYDFEDFSTKASLKMQHALRLGGHHAVCLAVHQSVWLEVGYFQPIPKLLGYEDTMFFNELAKANIATGITGAAWLHHYGSITQSAMKQERGLSQKDNLGYRYNYRLLKQNWLTRKCNKIKKNNQLKIWRNNELAQYGMTMHGTRVQGNFAWQ
ncbi:glycosyltransferase family 2 protein [Methylotenera sp.]|uniref:glycosyltransferase family 2 protein n=1 Tax=Methylotenera sp. TaxID=2051956 RepID=UPI00273079F7|nr:glycosyltransferase [Methylotenera sp.]MDP2070952.1 glycosyltransferase [Methylotenera sp.]MDP3005826.1 glycosyltransferase [Methylotenera sp.]